MKKLIAILLAVGLVFALASCGQASNPTIAGGNTSSPTSAPTPAATVEPTATTQPAAAPADNTDPNAGKVCFITEYPLGNPDMDMVEAGLTQIQSTGWTTNTIEALDSSQYEEDIRDMASQGYNVIMLFGAELINVGVDLADELKTTNPSLHLFMVLNTSDYQKDNVTSFSINPFESAFVAGYVAAMTTKTGTVGVIMHFNTPVMLPYCDGYMAGVAYANNGTQAVMSLTGNPTDVSLAHEAALTMIANNNVDIIFAAIYTATPGAFAACAEKGIKGISGDTYQGDVYPCLFWSQLSPVDVAVENVIKMYEAGGQLPGRVSFSAKTGNPLYDDRDFANLPADLQAKVTALAEDIKNGAIDVYKDYPDDKWDY